MEDSHRRILDRNLVTFAQDLELQEVLPIMIQHSILRRPTIDKIKTHTRYDANLAFIDALQHSGSRAFGVFLCSLYVTGQHDLLRTILPNWSEELERVEPTLFRQYSIALGRGSDAKALGEENGNEVPLRITEGGDTGSEDEWETEINASPTIPRVPQPREACPSAPALELKAYGDVTETDGVMTDLHVVEMTDSAAGVDSFFSERDMYPNFAAPKGPALIINNRDFEERSGHARRLGTDVDCENMKRLLIGLGYEVKVKDNLTARRMMEQMYSLVQKHPQRIKACSSLVVVVLSHGDHGKLIGVDGNHLSIEQFMEPVVTCQDLAQRCVPKIFIVQACRGKSYDSGITFMDGRGDEGRLGKRSGIPMHESIESISAIFRRLVDLDREDADGIRAKVPSNADTLIAYSTTPGYVSWRNSVRGSWFIQAICEIFAQYAHQEHILDMLTRVNQRVSEAISSSGQKQIPEPCSRLRRKFYFFPGVKLNPAAAAACGRNGSNVA